MAAATVALGAEIFGQGFRFLPTPHDAVTYYLPRLVAGEPLHDAVRPVVHHADVYACAPADLARRFCPLPKTGDRFFFTPEAQNTADIKARRGGGDDDAKVGELRKLRYKSGGVYTDWLMDEYSSVAGGGETQFVLCKMYVSPRAAPTSAAHKESAAYFFLTLPPPPPPPAASAAVFMQPAPAAAAPKRPAAPPQPAMSPPCTKRMRRGPVVLLQPAGGNASLPPPPPPQPPCAPPVLPTLTAVGKMPLAPPPQPSCAPRRGSTTRLATQPSPASAPLAPPVPVRPATQPHHSPMPLPAPPQPLQQQVPPLLPTPPVARTCHVPVPSKQRKILDPFEAAMLSDEAEDQTVPAAPHPPPPPAAAATPALQDEDEDEWDDLAKALEFGN
ncbi:actin-binding protein wsp1-like [Miscanthus floridulus]|uniref:actin-binding protein wsp1-like n=1 Tax=Miscanthus floridulus TaxID=154761 RepID=UPI00345856F7